MDVNDLRSELRDKVLILRSITRLTESERFLLAWRRAKDEERRALMEALKNENIRQIKELVDGLLKAEPSVSDLRDEAADLGIKNYSRMSKEELTIAIARRKS